MDIYYVNASVALGINYPWKRFSTGNEAKVFFLYSLSQIYAVRDSLLSKYLLLRAVVRKKVRLPLFLWTF